MQGFVGLGNMGAAIAEQLLDNGAPLLVYDVNAAAIALLEKAGATACSSAREIADRATLVITCLPAPAVSLTIAQEIAAGARVEIMADLSTIGRSTIIEMGCVLAAAGIQLVDAPVSGGPLGARMGTLSLMLAGPRDAARRVEETLSPVSGKTTYIGAAAGQAQLAKLVNNGISMTAFLVSCEVVAAAVGRGLAARDIVAYVNQGRGRNSGTVTKLPRNILDRTFDVGPTLVSALKDQDLFLEEYREASLPEGVIAGTRELWGRTTSVLDPHGDAATIVQYFERFTGAEVTTTGGRDDAVRAGDHELLELADDAIAFAVLAATCEAVAVGMAGGIEPAIQLELLNAGTARSYWSEDILGTQILSRRFNSGISIGKACDRLQSYLELAAGTGLPAGLVDSALAVWKKAATEIGANRDVTELMLLLEQKVGAKFIERA
ncbi:MAG: NAD-binding protein [Gammaproteobacteria bacterium]|nr:NAD-binding protein [Gammaproteobacteria bacterium]